MPSVSQRLQSLINEMDLIEELARSVQAGSAQYPKAPPEGAVTKLRVMYLDWHARGIELLKGPEKNAFVDSYSNATDCIERYLDDPTSSYVSSRGYGSIAQRQHVWRRDFETNFKRPFNAQRLLLMRVQASARVYEDSLPPSPPPAFDTIRLHSRVRAVSYKLFKDGHFREAINKACIALNEGVKQRSGLVTFDGTNLMQKVFSKDKPILKFEGHPDEQQGYMWLFSGMIMAIRNPRSHSVGEDEDLDANEALELLALASVLFRALDAAELVEPDT